MQNKDFSGFLFKCPTANSLIFAGAIRACKDFPSRSTLSFSSSENNTPGLVGVSKHTWRKQFSDFHDQIERQIKDSKCPLHLDLPEEVGSRKTLSGKREVS